MNIDIHIIINMNIEDYSALPIPVRLKEPFTTYLQSRCPCAALRPAAIIHATLRCAVLCSAALCYVP